MWTCPNCKTMQGLVIEKREGTELVECNKRLENPDSCAGEIFVVRWKARIKVDFTLCELVEVGTTEKENNK